MNNVNLIGRFVKDTELKYAAGSGTAVMRGTIAVDRQFKNKDGQKETDFIQILAFGKVAETISTYCGAKGDQIGITGKIQTGKYDDKNKVTHYTFEVVVNEITFLNAKKSNTDAESYLKNQGLEVEDGDMTLEDEDSPF